MSDWTKGYVTSLDYTFGYNHHLNPARIRLAFLERGLPFPDVENACELGFGQGLSVNIHAAASTTRWYGTDFNSAQSAFAQELASASGAKACLFDEDFETFTRRDDLPDFDFIGMHGIWSWVSEESRHIIVDFLRRKLKDGGVLYMSYNVLPGWGDFISMRNLMARYLETLSSQQRSLDTRIKMTVDFANKLLETKPQIEQSFPRLRMFMEKINNDNVHYLAHEYFNQEWRPMHFFDVEKLLGGAQLNYVCSADFLSNTYAVDITQEQFEFLKCIEEQTVRESVYDFISNRKFRSDLWMKGTRNTQKSSAQSLRKQNFILAVPRKNIPSKVHYARGTLDLNPEIYNPVLDLMEDLRPRSLEQIKSSLKNDTLRTLDIQLAVMVLLGIRALDIFQKNGAGNDVAAGQTRRLNAALRRHSSQGKNIEFLASPVTGGGVNVSRVSQLFLTSIEQGRTRPEEWAEYALQHFAELGEHLVKDGRTLGMEDEKRAELRARAEMFAQQSLPILKALGVA